MISERNIFIALVAVLCLFCMFFNVFFKTGKTAFAQVGSSYIVYDPHSKDVVSGENVHVRLENASTTKTVTLIVALENVKDLNCYVTVDKKAAGIEGSSIYLKAGQRWKYIDLLYGMMLRSGNDSAVQVALSTCGDIQSFVDKMNALVQKLGLKNTSFKNVTGLSEKGHFTSAYDLAVLTAYGYEKYPLFKDIVSCKYHQTDTVFEGDEEKKFTFKNKNKLLFSFDGACGVKTGYTKNSGRCLIAAAKRSNLNLIYVCLNKPDMWSDAADHLEKGFSSYEKVTLAKKGDVAGYLFSNEIKDYLPMIFENDLTLYLRSGDVDKLSFKIDKAQILEQIGEKSEYMKGFLKVYCHNDLIFETEVCNNISKYYK